MNTILILFRDIFVAPAVFFLFTILFLFLFLLFIYLLDFDYLLVHLFGFST